MTLAAPFAAIADLITRRTGLVFPAAREHTLTEAVGRLASRLRLRDPGQLAAKLEADAAALEELVADLTIPESYFFRGPEQFEALRRDVLPEIVRRRGPALRLLSAACAGGEEPYSLAITLAEEGLLHRSWIVGADISRPVLAKAAAACYPEWSLRGTTAAFRDRWFRREGARFQLREELRERIELVWLNLAEDFAPSLALGAGSFDVVFCRNALIYFHPDAVPAVARRLFGVLAEGGWLFAGASDPLLTPYAPFETVCTDAGILYRKPLAAPERSAPPPAAVVSREEVPREIEAPRAAARPPESAAEALSRVRVLADSGRLAEALGAAGAVAARLPASPEAQFLHAVLLAEAGLDRDAADRFRRTLFLHGTLAMAAFALGLSLRRLREPGAARRAFRQAKALAAREPRETPLPFGDGATAGTLLETIDLHLRLLEGVDDDRAELR